MLCHLLTGNSDAPVMRQDEVLHSMKLSNQGQYVHTELRVLCCVAVGPTAA